MQISKITAIVLALGVIVCSSEANATSLPSTNQLKPEAKLQLAQVNPEDALEYFKNGNKRLEKGDYQGAIVDLTKVIQINPQLAPAYYNRGVARHQLQDNQGAIADFTKVIQFNQTLFSSNRGEVFY